jgi:hypothetical protein
MRTETSVISARVQSKTSAIALLLATVVWLASASAAAASTSAPAWTITSIAEPTNFAPGDSSGHDQYVVVASNSGGAPTDGSTPITITVQLPAGLTLDPAGPSGTDDLFGSVTCSPGPPITCTDPQSTPLQPGMAMEMAVPVDVDPSAPASVTTSATVTGGGAASDASTSEPTTISSTPAPFALTSFDSSATNADGSTDTQAGSHPFQLTTSLNLTTKLDPSGNAEPSSSLKTVDVALPPGMIGDPTATPRCPHAQLNSLFLSCPADSQVGVVTILGTGLFGRADGTRPVYNMVPPPGMPAQFGFRVIFDPVYINTAVRTGSDYGVTATEVKTSEIIPLVGTTLSLWGVPSDPSHDSQRCEFLSTGCSPATPFQAPAKPLLTLPTACSGPLTTNVSVDSWQAPGDLKLGSSVTNDGAGNPVGVSGCNRLDFSPTLRVQPDVTTADSPSGLSVDLHVPQNDNTIGLAEADLKKAVVALPPGVAVSPSAADGLGACMPQQIGLDNANEPACPDSSKVGSVEVDTPLLPDPLKGSVFLAQQNNNPFGSLLAIYVTAEGDGVLVKLAGHVVPDPNTGQLTTTFDNNPPLPFSDFKLNFFGGPRASLVTPESCGTFTTTSSLSPWSATAAATPSDSFTINNGCVNGFSPSFTAGVTNVQAGAHTPFVLSFSRKDTDQELSSLNVSLPPGLVAKIAGVPLCSDLAANAGACPASSQVGTVEVGSGPGSSPFFLPGNVFLTGPYKGGPYGLAVVVRAIAGPFDLGTVVVRQAIHVDPTDARVSVTSDPFPTMLQGIPLKVRRVDVNLSRRNFTVNPTSCNPMQVTGTLFSTHGTSERLSSRFQVAGCSGLGFSPHLRLALTGKGRTHSGNHPTLTANLTQGLGQANMRSARVTLPLSMALDPNNSQHVCSFPVAQAVHGGAVGCPANTIVGKATAVTPLLDRPLNGNVYLVQGIRFSHGRQIRTLPTLLVALRGQIALDLRAQSSVDGASRLVTTFATIPDAAVSSFKLTINGGPRGILVITGRGRNICNAPQTAQVRLTAQSGSTEQLTPTITKPCHPAHKRHRR